MQSIEAPPLELTTIKSLLEANRVLDELVDVVPDSFGIDLRADLGMVFSSVAYEHVQSIVFLSQHRACFGSAMALFRVLLETIIRGEWLYFCATDQERLSFAQKSLQLDSNPFKRMAAQLDEKHGLMRFADYEPFYAQMCDYAHTGHDAICRRTYGYGALLPKSTEPQIRALLSQSCLALVIHFEVLCDALGDQHRFDQLALIAASINLVR